VSDSLLPITILSLAAVLLLSYGIARSTSKPITDLSEVMRKSTEMANLDIRLPEHRQTVEIAALYDSYAALIERIKSLLKEVFEQGVSVKQAEIRALQAQINPHFLYNTLDSINWAALDLGDVEIPAVVSSLSNILRYSIKEPDKLATLGEELDIVKHYLDIQRFCYSLDIQLILEGAQAGYDIQIPKLTLQPIVENAIIHGFLENGKKSGAIFIRTCEENGAVICEIENEGEADIEKMNAIIHNGRETPRHGIRNVHYRLQMLFGEPSGLRFYQNNSGALVVVLTIRRE
jgi:two-component system sensor histidine kinase YesM